MNFHLHAALRAVIHSGASLFIFATAFHANAQTDKDTVRWDDRSGQWVYTLYNPADLTQFQDIRYTPRSLTGPQVKSRVNVSPNLNEYEYRITNAAGARQTISEISVFSPKWDASVPRPLGPVEGETHAQALARVREGAAKIESFTAKTIHSPSRWDAFLNVNRPTRVVFGWLAELSKSFRGIAPGTRQNGFSVLRPELPGAAWMSFQGDTPDTYYAANLPRTGAQAEHAEKVLSEDSVEVAILVPAIIVPTPYSGQELVSRIKAHVNTWNESGLANGEVISALNRWLDALNNSVATNNKAGAKSQVASIAAEINRHHIKLRMDDPEDEADENHSKAVNRKDIDAQGKLVEVKGALPEPKINRVAARALMIDLKYVLSRM